MSRPAPCGICGWAVIGGLTIGGRRAAQAMRREGQGFVHMNRDVCQVLKKTDKVGKYVRDDSAIPTDADRSPTNVEDGDLLYLPGQVGLDSGYDEPSGE